MCACLCARFLPEPCNFVFFSFKYVRAMVVSMRTSASALTNIKKKKEEKNTRLEMVTNR